LVEIREEAILYGRDNTRLCLFTMVAYRPPIKENLLFSVRITDLIFTAFHRIIIPVHA